MRSTQESLLRLVVVVLSHSHALLPSSSLSSSRRSHRRLSQRPPQTRYSHCTVALGSTATPPESSSSSSSSENVEFTDFWGSKIRKTSRNEEHEQQLPCIPSLDPLKGALPSNAYTLLPNSVDPKLTCRISLAVSSSDPQQKQPDNGASASSLSDTQEEKVQQLQRCLDAGFQTFQIPSSSSTLQRDLSLIARFHDQTPSYIESHWVVPFRWESSSPDPRSTTLKQRQQLLRDNVLGQLTTMNQNAHDTLLVHYNSPTTITSSSLEDDCYFLEGLEYLTELQQEGYIRSIGMVTDSPTLVQQALEYGFPIATQQQPGHLFSYPTTHPSSSGGSCSNNNNSHDNKTRRTAQWWTNPWANDFLTERYLGTKHPPSNDFFASLVNEWNHLQQPSWKAFQQQVIVDTLQHIGRKYQVPTASVALRWALQQQQRHSSSNSDGCGNSVVMPMSLVAQDENRRLSFATSMTELRGAFRFRLESDDLESLNALRVASRSSTASNEHLLPKDLLQDYHQQELPLSVIEELEEELERLHQREKDEKGDEDYPTIDFGNRDLWL